MRGDGPRRSSGWRTDFSPDRATQRRATATSGPDGYIDHCENSEEAPEERRVFGDIPAFKSGEEPRPKDATPRFRLQQHRDGELPLSPMSPDSV